MPQAFGVSSFAGGLGVEGNGNLAPTRISASRAFSSSELRAWEREGFAFELGKRE
jgi:hypothetical protein